MTRKNSYSGNNKLINHKTFTIELSQKEFVVISIEYFVLDPPTGTGNN